MTRLTQSARSSAQGGGLLAEYYNDTALGQEGGSRIATQLDPELNFDFSATPPPAGQGADHFSVRWSGTFTPRYSEKYLLMTGSDDGVRIYVDGELKIDRWDNHPLAWDWFYMDLVAGRPYTVEVDYFQGVGAARLYLYWQSASQQMEIIPPSQLSPPAATSPGHTTYYVSSASGSNGNDGLAPDRAWHDVGAVNARVFAPGDRILFERGGYYPGTLQPQGSGAPGAPIVIDVYGSGSSPRIDGQAQDEAILLFNQEYWEINSLDVTGGKRFGLLVSGDQAGRTLHHVHLANLEVHDIYADPRWDSGLVVVSPFGDRMTFDDVLVDRVSAHNTNLWYGIHVGFNFQYGGGYAINPPRTTGVTIQNSTVHDVYGDGITVAQGRNVMIQHNLVRSTGLAPAGISYTPNGIWTWQCDQATIQWNEGYLTHSYSYDGGVFDIDWGSTNTVVQYNYAHDADGYCVAVMGAHHGSSGQPVTTSNSVVRFNVCSNNGRKPGMAAWEGDIFLTTFDGGNLDGVQIYNNTSYWNPADDGAWLKGRNLATLTNPFFVVNNLVDSTTPSLIDVDASVALNNNLYWLSGDGTPTWSWQRTTSHRLGDLQAVSGQESNAIYANPRVADATFHGTEWPLTQFTPQFESPARSAARSWPGMGYSDIAGHVLPAGGARDIGAVNSE